MTRPVRDFKSYRWPIAGRNTGRDLIAVPVTTLRLLVENSQALRRERSF